MGPPPGGLSTRKSPGLYGKSFSLFSLFSGLLLSLTGNAYFARKNPNHQGKILVFFARCLSRQARNFDRFPPQFFPQGLAFFGRIM
jgi:hypothetical protein